MAFRHYKSPVWLVIADSNPGELQLCEPNNCLQKVVASSALRPAQSSPICSLMLREEMLSAVPHTS